MKVVVIGGSGLIGSKVVANLRQKGHEVTAASPRSGVNTITGEGLAGALKGAEIVMDVANSPSFEDGPVMEFFTTSGRNLLAAEAVAGVRHHIALSVVGVDRCAQGGYFRAKLAQEDLIRASGIPYTIVRATQFFEFIDGIAGSAGEGDTIHLRQPISSRSPRMMSRPWWREWRPRRRSMVLSSWQGRNVSISMNWCGATCRPAMIPAKWWRMSMRVISAWNSMTRRLPRVSIRRSVPSPLRPGLPNPPRGSRGIERRIS